MTSSQTPYNGVNPTSDIPSGWLHFAWFAVQSAGRED
jgi:hypothetical protein